jgi:hypothetical protein
VITTFDGVDDNPTSSSGSPPTTQQAFQADEGVVVNFPGHEPVSSTSPHIKNVMRFNVVPGGEAGVTYTGKPLPVRISGSQTSNRVPVNSVAVRMRVPLGGPKGAAATLTLTDGPSLRLPSSCNGRSGCKESAALIPDGKWHTYSANLSSNAAFVDKAFTGFKFVPSDKGFDGGEDGIEVEYIRISHLPGAATPTRSGCRAARAASWPTATPEEAARPLPGAVASAPPPWSTSARLPRLRGQLPAVFNPLQEDGDNNGIGDACEDLDGDGVVNAWDNCPSSATRASAIRTATASATSATAARGEGCFLKPELARRPRLARRPVRWWRGLRRLAGRSPSAGGGSSDSGNGSP